ncbi:replication-relaxation family protein [Streptomyces sp. NPDC056544]|uniref:replication-relaxation family protein n=1 Tax=unclassified Streptomyces TaxID=2593676 RepID=UPI0036A393B2
MADQAPDSPTPAGCNSSSPSTDVPGEASRPRRKAAATKAGADIRGDVLLALAQLRLASPRQLKALLLPHQQGTDHVRRALRNLQGESPALVGRTHRAQQSYWYCTPAGLAEAAASGELAPTVGRTTGRRAAGKTGLREHGLALVDTVVAFHQAQVADHTDWQVEVAHPTPAGTLVPDGVVLLASGASAFVEIDRTMSYARLVAKLERYDAYRNAPASGRGNAARAPRSHWQETYAGPSLERPFPVVLFVFAPAPRRAAPTTREAAFHERARRVGSVNYRLTVATTTLPRLTRDGADAPVWRVVGNGHGEERRTLAALPKAR